MEKLQSEHKTASVIAEYKRNIVSLQEIARENGNILNKSVLEKWKRTQKNLGIAQGTLTNRVVRINHLLRYMGCEELCFPKGGKLNLEGKRFGNLIVLEMAEGKSSDHSIRWKCRCLSCGKIKEISANQLTKGVQISCG